MGTIVLQVDPENSTKALARALGTERGRQGSRTILRQSPKGSKGSLGGCERFHQTAQGMARTFKLSIEKKYGVKLNTHSALTPWIMRHGGFLVPRCVVRADGRTAYHALRGKPYTSKLLQLGEIVEGKLQDKDVDEWRDCLTGYTSYWTCSQKSVKLGIAFRVVSCIRCGESKP